MKITIDTKNDTREEIRRTIHFLRTLVEAQAYQQNSFAPASESSQSAPSSSSPSGNAFGAMFGSSSSAPSESPEPTQSLDESADYVDNPLAGTSPPANVPSSRRLIDDKEDIDDRKIDLQTY